MRILMAVILLFVASGHARGQSEVYRCQVGGKVTYSDRECDGIERMVRTDGRSTAAEVAAARIRSQRERTASLEHAIPSAQIQGPRELAPTRTAPR
jgi:hypothetical protein